MRLIAFVILIGTAFCHAVDFTLANSLPQRTENKVFRSAIKPIWLPDGKSFWYRVQTGPTSREYVLINAENGERKTAATLKALGIAADDTEKTSASPLAVHPSKHGGTEVALTFVSKLDTDVDLFWINTAGAHVRYGGIRPHSEREISTFERHVWLITSRAGEHLAVIEAKGATQTVVIDGKGISAEKPAQESAASRESGKKSPDNHWTARIEKGAVILRDLQTNQDSQPKADIDAKSPFHGECEWAPDSSAFVAWASREPAQRKVTIVESSPKSQLQPKVLELDYTKAGDELPQPIPVIFRIIGTACEAMRVKADLFPNPFTQSTHLPIRWAPDSSEFFFDYNQRGHQLYRILAVNTKSGAVRTVVEETSRTFIDYTSKTWRHWLAKTGELLWMSERDGWCHLWLYDVATGKAKHQITQGPWVVREVLHVDEAAREVWFMAGGIRPKEDPYHQHLCHVKFDGTGFKQLTNSDGNHRISFSPTREYFVATWSRADHAPITELRRSSDGGLVCVVETADATALLASGWTLPERFVAKGRDGKTDIHGIIIKPSHFDAAKHYPVVEEVYAGPHSAFAPKEFGRMLRQHTIAELGFIVVQADGMGTNHRGKVFHDVCWKNLKDAGFPDRIAWIKAAASSRPWMDLQRVGIYGGSAGGQSAMRALLDYNDFYKVAVADCGCHDNRMDKIWWNEQWMGWPVDDSYKLSSNAEDAAKLKGHLLLIVGELDHNVDPASTLQVVNALEKADKDFEFLPITGSDHGAAESPYGSRKRMEFLVRHLYGSELTHLPP